MSSLRIRRILRQKYMHIIRVEHFHEESRIFTHTNTLPNTEVHRSIQIFFCVFQKVTAKKNGEKGTLHQIKCGLRFIIVLILNVK